jgi:hypothetical protein
VGRGGRKRNERILTPLKGKVKKRKIVTFDIESKDGDTQNRGFTRPFLVDFFDGEKHYEFRNSPSVAHLPWETRHIERGGCIDKFMRWLFGMDGCRFCNYTDNLSRATERGRGCALCREHRRRFIAKSCDIYSHNGGRFDELFLIGWLLKNRRYVRFEVTSAGNRVQRLEVTPVGKGKHSTLSWSFLDSAALIPLSLHKIGKDIVGGVEKIAAVQNSMALAKEKKVDHNLDLHEDDPDWTTYVRADNEVLFLGLHRFIELIRDLGGDIGVTAPSTSMKLFRMKYQKRTIMRNRHFKSCDGLCKNVIVRPDGSKMPCATFCDFSCHGCAHAFAREGYYGGRTELFRRKGRNIQYYDINSSYPASMLEDMPVGDMLELDCNLSWDALRAMRKSHIGFIECEVEIPPGVEVPPLPVRHDGKLVFPTGRFRGVWDFDELELLFHPLVRGRVIKVYRSVWYEADTVFLTMVRKLYHYRTKHQGECYTNDKGKGSVCGQKSCNVDYTESIAFVAKLMLNSLYGKFGMREDRTGVVMVGEGEEPPMDEGWPMNGQHSSPFWEVERYVDAAYVIPQISAHITTLSRIRLWRGMAEVVERGGVLYYVDTDSIMCSVPITTSDGLGGWKREEVGNLLEGEFILPKLYQLKMHKQHCIDLHCPGCSRPADHPHRHDCEDKECQGCAVSVEKMKGVQHRNQTPESYRHMVYEKGTIEGIRLTQARTMFNKGMLSPTMVPAKKSLQTEYDKRVMLPDGSSVALHLELTGEEL